MSHLNCSSLRFLTFGGGELEKMTNPFPYCSKMPLPDNLWTQLPSSPYAEDNPKLVETIFSYNLVPFFFMCMLMETSHYKLSSLSGKLQVGKEYRRTSFVFFSAS